jgi:hypothetical protein
MAEILQCAIHTRFGLQQFRNQTLLIFHNPVAKRARHAAFGGITPLRGIGASFACVPGAARS